MFKPLLRHGAVLAVLAGGLSPLALAPGAAHAAPPSCPDGQPDNKSAAAKAAECGGRVEILPLRTENSQTFAKPGGGFATEEYLEPRWSRKPDGSWAPIDTTLTASAAGVVPKASALPVVFSPGGTGPLAVLRNGDKEISVSWPGGALPKPALAGDSATYPEVLPGVDLKVTASARGFSEVLVVRTREAAKHPALAEVKFGLSAKGVSTVAEAGGLVARDDAGRTVFTSPAPEMWDSADRRAVTPRAKGLSAGAPADTASEPKKAVMPVKAGGGVLSVTPDKKMVDAPDTVYPIYIDPSWSGGLRNNNWRVVASKVPASDSFTLLQPEKGNAGAGRVCDDYSGGTCYSTQYKVRTLFQLDTSGARGHKVTKGTFSITQKHAWTCNPASGSALWLTRNNQNTENFSGTSWNVTENGGQFEWRDRRYEKDNYRCQGDTRIEFDVTAWVNPNDWYMGLAFRADDEGTVNQWKRYDAGTAALSVEYNDPPTAPDWLQADGRNCGDDNNRPILTTATPTLSGRVWGPDYDKQTLWLAAVKRNNGYWDENQVTAGSQANVDWGTRGSWQIPWDRRLADGGVYALRAQANDPGGVGPVTATGPCQFEIDLTKPAAPTVVSPEYPASCAMTACGGIGVSGRFTFDSDSDVTKFVWGFTDPPSKEVAAARKGDAVTVSWTPQDGANNLQQTLYVQAVDHAGWVSETKKYQFLVRESAPPVVHWKLNETEGTTLANSQAGSSLAATLKGGLLGQPSRVVGAEENTVLVLNGTDAQHATAQPIVDTRNSFSVAAWVRADETGTFRTFVSQCGTEHCAYYLQYNHLQDRWVFILPSEDKASPSAYYYAKSALAPKPGVWTHLAGVYDAGAGQVRLYVNGQLEGQEAAGATWNATGQTFLGQAKGTNFAKGALSDVQIWDRAITAREAGEAATASRAGLWHLDETIQGRDDSVFDRELSLTATGGASFRDGSLHVTGTGYATTARDGQERPVLNTDQSYTLSARVRLTHPSLPHWNLTVLGQDGAQISPFYLGYLGYGTTEPRWSLACTAEDRTGAAFKRVNSLAKLTTADLNKWVHLVGVYDATAGQIRLYVDDVLQGSADCKGWNAAGSFTVGRAKYDAKPADFWVGDIDEVHAYQGVVPSAQIVGIEGPRTGPIRWAGGPQCVALPAGSLTDPRGVFLWDCLDPATHDEQRWTYDAADRSLRSKNHCATVDGKAIRMAVCDKQPGQLWAYDPATQAFSTAGGCLDVPNGVYDRQLGLQLWPCNGSQAQKFRLS
ncbi:LamG-like jellyroll fold domain-containing protein [Longispora albida]|uniref:LamG-like jellyroll fold domain-containing protein n=1 Tax=Longispora albida TaxID=203523 RepID=UPI000362DEE1|nr:LamG-like jellyroll fold domain-containing protein [Longispora albida]